MSRRSLKPDTTNTPATRADVDRFLDAVEQLPPATQRSGRGRLIFALDATASRQPTWDQASSLQGDMFVRTEGLGGLDVQLVYYRGYRECRASKWVQNGERLLSLMQRVSCEAGRTQIARVLEHGLAEARRRPVQALVFVGDAVEEPIDMLGDLAGQLKLVGLPVFVFQEGQHAEATRAFAAIARLSGGAHGRFDHSAPNQLAELLQAVAAYATGGRDALARLDGPNRAAHRLLEQLG